MDFHDPGPVAIELAGKLSARTRHVCALLGAGASRAACRPDLQQLQDAVKASKELDADQKIRAAALLTGRNLEDALRLPAPPRAHSRTRRLRRWLRCCLGAQSPIGHDAGDRAGAR
jgi:hypothetical protein